MRISETELLALLAGFLWPFLRVGALFVSMPIFSNHSVPLRARILMTLGVTVTLMPTLPAMPEVPLFSLGGLLIGIQQVVVGALFGLVLNFIFAAIVFGGQSVAYSMGLGFAALIDPQSGVQVPVIAQFYLILATLIFLGMDGHLLMIQLLAESFRAIPVDLRGLDGDRLWGICLWSSQLFAAGVLMSLPIIGALLLINLGFGVASRSAPQLNIFSVGFPVSLLVGLVLIWAGLPNVMEFFAGFLEQGYQVLHQMIQK